jgi:hypothetical protein
MTNVDTLSTDETADGWEKLETNRDLLREIAENNGPFAPDARGLLRMLDAKQRGEFD